MCWDRVTLHDYPSNFVEIRVVLNLSSKEETQQNISQLLSIRPSIGYDQIHHQLRAFGDNIRQCVVLLAISKRFLKNTLSKSQAIKTIPILMDEVNSASKNYKPQLYDSLVKEICKKTT